MAFCADRMLEPLHAITASMTPATAAITTVAANYRSLLASRSDSSSVKISPVIPSSVDKQRTVKLTSCVNQSSVHTCCIDTQIGKLAHRLCMIRLQYYLTHRAA